MNKGKEQFDWKALLLNSVIVVLCSVPKVGWLCFIAVALLYLRAAFRYAKTKRRFVIGALTPAAASALYFAAHQLNADHQELGVYFIGVAIQLLAVGAMVTVVHFTIWKSSREYIKGGV